MERKVAIAGWAQTEHTSDAGVPRERMVYELVKELFSEVGITRDDIDTFVMSSNDFMDGRTISNVFMDSPSGAYMKDETKVESDGTAATEYAWMRILSGHYDTALVIGYSKGSSEFRPYLIMDYSLSPVFERELGIISELSAAALQARAYMMKYGLTEEHLDLITAKAMKNAAINPFALRRDGASKDDISASRMLFDPLRELHCYPHTDGACLLLLASGDRAEELTDKPVWIEGAGNSLDTYYLCERDLTKSTAAGEAAERAYKLAGISDPSSEIDLAEISAPFASQEPILSEALGLFPEGSGAEVIEKGESDIGGRLPLCPSGGALGAHALCASGMVRIAEAVRQLRGEAGDAQVEGAKVAAAHGQDGMCAQHNTVFVLRR